MLEESRFRTRTGFVHNESQGFVSPPARARVHTGKEKADPIRASRELAANRAQSRRNRYGVGLGANHRTFSKVEMWRGGVGLVYLFPALSSAGASLAWPCSVSTSRSSNRTCAINASGSRRKHHGFAHEKLCVRSASLVRP